MKKEKFVSIIGTLILIIGIIISGIRFFTPSKGLSVSGDPVIDSSLLETFKGEEKLSLITPDGDDEAYHPKVVAFDKEWNGYKYWIAFTPYPQGDESKENPVINFSNDMETWYAYKDKKALDVPENAGEQHYNSDTHLLYNPDEDQLELFWRYVNEESKDVTIYKMTTKNGIDWSEKEVFLYSKSRSNRDYVSPAIIYENGTYKIWYVDKKQVFYIEKSGDTLSETRQLDIEYENGYHTWHIDVIYNTKYKKYEMITNAYADVNDRTGMYVYYLSSKDNVKWSSPIGILAPTEDGDNWNSQGLYRSALLYYNNKYYVFYSAHNKEYEVGVGLACGTEIDELKAC